MSGATRKAPSKPRAKARGGPPGPSKRPAPPETVTVGLKMSLALRKSFREAAVEEGLTLSGWIRRSCIRQRMLQDRERLGDLLA